MNFVFSDFSQYACEMFSRNPHCFWGGHTPHPGRANPRYSSLLLERKRAIFHFEVFLRATKLQFFYHCAANVDLNFQTLVSTDVEFLGHHMPVRRGNVCHIHVANCCENCTFVTIGNSVSTKFQNRSVKWAQFNSYPMLPPECPIHTYQTWAARSNGSRVVNKKLLFWSFAKRSQSSVGFRSATAPQLHVTKQKARVIEAQHRAIQNNRTHENRMFRSWGVFARVGTRKKKKTGNSAVFFSHSCGESANFEVRISCLACW